MKKYVKLVFIGLLSCIIFILIWATTVSAVKHIDKAILVESFKARGKLDEASSTDKIKYYKIESNETRPAFTKTSGGYVIPGSAGDILTATTAVIGDGLYPLIGDALNGFIGFYAGGHAALCTKDYQDYEFSTDEYQSIEASGTEGEGNNPSRVNYRSYWAGDIPYKEVIGLRVKLSDKEIDEVMSNCASMLNDPYNFSFIFDTINNSYCTDILSKAFIKYANLNKDGFATTVWDLICSGDTYISYYHYFDNAGVKHIYYLDWRK